MSTLKIDLLEGTKDYISKAIQKNIEDEFDNTMKALNQRKNEVVAGILLNVMKTVEMQSVGDKLTVTIREIQK